jgi:hypothetical protein
LAGARFRNSKLGEGGAVDQSKFQHGLEAIIAQVRAETEALAEGRRGQKGELKMFGINTQSSLKEIEISTEEPAFAGIIKNRLRTYQNGPLFTETVRITPQDAAYILEGYNIGNRSMKDSKIRQFALAIDSGHWRLTSQGISFSRCGVLNDGQNRLAACVISGKSIDIRVTWGEPREVFSVLDTGARRSAGDVLGIEGMKNSKALAAGAKLVLYLDTGRSDPTPDDLLEFVTANPGIEDASSLGQKIAVTLKTSSAACVAAVFLIMRNSRSADRLPAFCEKLIDGTGLTKDDPVLLLRDGLIKKRFDQGVRGGIGRTVQIAACFIKGWNAWSRHKRIAMLVFRPKANETFPIVE